MIAIPDSTTYEQRTLTRHEEVSPGVFLIGVERTHSFLPGQSVKLGIDPADEPRIYSICSGPDEKDLCILFNVKPGGLLTPALAERTVGDSVWISEPFGTFLVGDEPSWMIATGTGIAPFHARHRMAGLPHATLVHGARRSDQFYFEEAFTRALDKRYHRCCSREQADGLLTGRVTDFLSHRADLPTDCIYYICGQARMAVDVRDLLLAKGVPLKQIKTEIYF